MVTVYDNQGNENLCKKAVKRKEFDYFFKIK